MGGWMDGWTDFKAVLRIAYSNQKDLLPSAKLRALTYPKQELRKFRNLILNQMYQNEGDPQNNQLGKA